MNLQCVSNAKAQAEKCWSVHVNVSDCNISSVRFGMDKETGEFRGYAHVDFSNNLSLTMALMLEQEIACGRPVKISCAVPMKGATTDSSSPTSGKADGAGMSSGSGKKKRTC
ncbi:hypothetical protein L1049_026304 [Liquidambar formosana]|uniref:Uncharacterized protein n=1 Tax=Liquidambar formosana TaxID=63359 RepID=A0AAP0R8Y3_LIQFO